MKYKKGDVLEKRGAEMRIAEIYGEICFPVSKTGIALRPQTEKELDESGFTLKQEGPWVPKKGEYYFFLSDASNPEMQINLGHEIDLFRISIGNCHQTEEKVEQYKQWLLTKPYRV